MDSKLDSKVEGFDRHRNFFPIELRPISIGVDDRRRLKTLIAADRTLTDFDRKGLSGRVHPQYIMCKLNNDRTAFKQTFYVHRICGCSLNYLEVKTTITCEIEKLIACLSSKLFH